MPCNSAETTLKPPGEHDEISGNHFQISLKSSETPRNALKCLLWKPLETLFYSIKKMKKKSFGGLLKSSKTSWNVLKPRWNIPEDFGKASWQLRKSLSSHLKSRSRKTIWGRFSLRKPGNFSEKALKRLETYWNAFEIPLKHFRILLESSCNHRKPLLNPPETSCKLPWKLTI